MGNQQSLLKTTVYEDEGKYIIPTKVKIHSQTEDAQVLKNIFGVSDPALLARSYWAKDEPYKGNIPDRNFSRSPSKSRRLGESGIGGHNQNGQSNGFEWARQSLLRSDREAFGRSIVSNFREDLKETPSRNLSKITSCSIISKLNQFQGDLQSTSPLKQFEKPSILNLYHNKNKENIHSESQGSPNIASKHGRKTQKCQISPLQKSRLSHHQQSRINDQIQNHMSKLFGLSNNSSEYSRSKFSQNSIAMSKKDQYTETEPIQENNQQVQHNNSSALNHEICEQTFSRFEENPALLCASNQDKSSYSSKKSKNFDILSKKTHSKHSDIQKFDGLNEDSKNESLMKVLKRVTEISIDEPNQLNQGLNAIRVYPLRENTSQIMTENLNRHDVIFKNSETSETLRSHQNKKQEKCSQHQQSPFEFYLHEVKQTQSQKSFQKAKSNHQRSPLNSNKSSNFSYQNTKNFKIFSQAPKSISKSQSKLSIYQPTELNENNKFLRQNNKRTSFGYLENEESRTEEKSSNLINLNNDEYFKFSKVKSPKSISSEQVGLTRQRSCAGRIIETSKAANNKEYSSPFKSKKYDFSKKNSAQKENSPNSRFRPQTSNKSPSSKQTSTKPIDYQLMLKIETLEGELNTLKLKKELEKFESRRYSPVKQERSKRKPLNQENEEVEQKEQKYCINEFSRSTPFKHRSQYFKLKLK